MCGKYTAPWLTLWLPAFPLLGSGVIHSLWGTFQFLTIRTGRWLTRSSMWLTAPSHNFLEAFREASVAWDQIFYRLKPCYFLPVTEIYFSTSLPSRGFLNLFIFHLSGSELLILTLLKSIFGKLSSNTSFVPSYFFFITPQSNISPFLYIYPFLNDFWMFWNIKISKLCPVLWTISSRLLFVFKLDYGIPRYAKRFYLM